MSRNTYRNIILCAIVALVILAIAAVAAFVVVPNLRSEASETVVTKIAAVEEATEETVEETTEEAIQAPEVVEETANVEAVAEAPVAPVVDISVADAMEIFFDEDSVTIVTESEATPVEADTIGAYTVNSTLIALTNEKFASAKKTVKVTKTAKKSFFVDGGVKVDGKGRLSSTGHVTVSKVLDGGFYTSETTISVTAAFELTKMEKALKKGTGYAHRLVDSTKPYEKYGWLETSNGLVDILLQEGEYCLYPYGKKASSKKPAAPTKAPTAVPTVAPTAVPTVAPVEPTKAPVRPTVAPTAAPTAVPTQEPTATPTATPAPVPAHNPDDDIVVVEEEAEQAPAHNPDDDVVVVEEPVAPAPRHNDDEATVKVADSQMDEGVTRVSEELEAKLPPRHNEDEVTVEEEKVAPRHNDEEEEEVTVEVTTDSSESVTRRHSDDDEVVTNENGDSRSTRTLPRR